MFAYRSVLCGPSAPARTQCSLRGHQSASRRFSNLQLEALEQRHLLTATVLTVDTTADVVDPLDGMLSLREAVLEANASPNDYEIHLPAGTYTLTRQGANEDAALTGDLDILNNGSLTIVGAGSGSTTIDASGLYDAGLGYGDRIFDVQTEATVDIEGVTLTKGYASDGGGAVRGTKANLTLTTTVLVDNTASYGGAIASDRTLTLEGCEFISNWAGTGGAITSAGELHALQTLFVNNEAAEFNGGAVSDSGYGPMVFTSCTFTGNHARFPGGAISTLGGTHELVIVDSLLSGNSAVGGGGAIFSMAARLTISNTQILNNSTQSHGGGIYSLGGPVTVDHSVVRGNTASGRGGGIYTESPLQISYTSVENNSADLDGGGVYYAGNAAAVVDNSTIANNTANNGGGISGRTKLQSSTVSGNLARTSGGGLLGVASIENSTVTGNRADSDGDMNGDGGGIFTPPSITSGVLSNAIVAGNLRGTGSSESPSDIELSYGQLDPASSYNLIGDPNTAGGLVNGVNGNIVGDGLGNVLDIHSILDTNLADNGGPTLTHALVPGSPALNAGDPAFDPNATDPPLLYDQRGVGFDRVVFGRVDIGAVEAQHDPTPVGGVINVDTFDDILADDGLWSLREAVIYANTHAGDFEIHLGAGTYTLTRQGANEDAALTGDLDILNNGSLTIVGAGSGSTTIDASGLYDAGLGYGDRIFDAQSAAVFKIDGLALTGGDRGGAIRVRQANTTIDRCLIQSNSAEDGGVIGGYGEIHVSRSILIDNTSRGAVISSSGQLDISFSEIRNNSVGGAVIGGDGEIHVSRSILIDNTSRGAAIYSYGQLDVSFSEIRNNPGGGIDSRGPTTLTDSVVSGNVAEIGGGIHFVEGVPGNLCLIVRSTISGNTATGRGAGGIFAEGDISIIDSTISGNQSAGEGGGVVIYSPLLRATLTIANSTVSGNSAAQGGGGIVNRSKMIIENSTVTGNTAAGAGGISSWSPLFSSRLISSIVAGNVGGDLDRVDSSSSYNIIGDPNSAGGLVNGMNGNIVGDGLGNLLDIHSVLDTNLADNGGPTLTHALVPGSPAFNAGNPLFDPDLTNPPLNYDQRGTGYDRIKNGRVDIGALEGINDPAPVSGVVHVTTFDDVLADDGLWSLREAVIYANSHPGDLKIVLDVGEYVLTRRGRGEDAAVTGDLDILNNGRVEIVGSENGITTISAIGLLDPVDGLNDRIFDAKAGSVLELSHLHLTGGSLPGSSPVDERQSAGGAIINDGGTITISDATLDANSAIAGGAIFNRSGSLVVQRTTFTGNSAGRGGAIQSAGTLSIEQSSFWANTAVNGGAIYSVGTATFQNTQFSDNLADSFGGAIVNRGEMMIAGGSISSNSANAGGGIYSSVDDGTATPANHSAAKLTVSGVTVLDNTADSGAGIYCAGTNSYDELNSQLVISHSELANNVSNQYGGGIFAIASDVDIATSNITSNRSGRGGGLYAATLDDQQTLGPTVRIDASNISGNTAFSGGGVLASLVELLIQNSTVAENRAYTDGGGIEVTGDFTIVRSAIIENVAKSGGGIGIDSPTSSVHLLESTISGNRADGFGGGIYSWYATSGVFIIVEQCTITDNRADYDESMSGTGGGVYGSVLLRGSIVAGNYLGAGGTSNDLGTPADPASSFNLIGDPNTAGGLVNGVNGNIVGDGLGNLLDIHSILDTNLADNGGPTLTHALVPGSPALNAGDPAFDPNATNPPTLFDQRGAGYARVTGGRVDIGAFEFGSTFENVIAGRHVFYDDSLFDGGTPGPNANLGDQLAVAPDKQPLLPGSGLATAANVTSYSAGINGIMVDIAGSHPDITAADFLFHMGNNNAPETWVAAPAPSAVSILPGGGDGGADRVIITWPSGSIRNTWLEVQVLANANTGLTSPDVFYFGNRIGDSLTNPGSGTFDTTTTDSMQVFATQGGNKSITDPRDFNRDGLINSTDSMIVFANLGSIVRLNLAAPVPLVTPSVTPAVELSTNNRASAVASALTVRSVANAAADSTAPTTQSTRSEVGTGTVRSLDGRHELRMQAVSAALEAMTATDEVDFMSDFEDELLGELLAQ